MSAQTEHVALMTKIQSFWNESTMGAIVYPNMNRRTDPQAIRTGVEISHGKSNRQRADLGNPRMVHAFGIILFVVHAPTETGTLQTAAIYDTICANLDEWRTKLPDGGTIIFDTCNRQELGTKEGSFRTNIICSFRLTEFAPSA